MNNSKKAKNGFVTKLLIISISVIFAFLVTFAAYNILHGIHIYGNFFHLCEALVTIFAFLIPAISLPVVACCVICSFPLLKREVRSRRDIILFSVSLFLLIASTVFTVFLLIFALK